MQKRGRDLVLLYLRHNSLRKILSTLSFKGGSLIRVADGVLGKQLHNYCLSPFLSCCSCLSAVSTESYFFFQSVNVCVCVHVHMCFVSSPSVGCGEENVLGPCRWPPCGRAPPASRWACCGGFTGPAPRPFDVREASPCVPVHKSKSQRHMSESITPPG